MYIYVASRTCVSEKVWIGFFQIFRKAGAFCRKFAETVPVVALGGVLLDYGIYLPDLVFADFTLLAQVVELLALSRKGSCLCFRGERYCQGLSPSSVRSRCDLRLSFMCFCSSILRGGG